MPAPVPGVDGNWTCPSCHNVNFAMRTVCNRCASPKPHLFAAGQLGGASRGKGRPVAGVDGNWACPLCQNVNFAMREACNLCQAPKPVQEDEVKAGQRLQMFTPMVAGKGASLRGQPVANVDGSWVCPHCENVNFASRTACNRCQAPKPEQNGAAPAPLALPAAQSGTKRGPVAGLDGNWACITCRNVNFAAREVCNLCQRPKPREVAPPSYVQAAAHQVPPQQMPGRPPSRGPLPGVDGNWSCVHCRNVNYGIREACNRCQAPRPQQPLPYLFQQPPHGGGGAGRSGGPVAGVDGNWVCPYCKNVNFAMREACNRCKAPRPMEEEPPAAVPPPAPSPATLRGRGPIPGVDGNWSCDLCHNVNFAAREVCNRCQAPKRQAQQPFRAPGKAPVAGVDGNWACPNCHNVNFPNRVVCNRCNAPRPSGGKVPGRAPVAGVDGNWACPLCNNVNYAMREACNRCQAPKPLDDPLLDGAFGALEQAEEEVADLDQQELELMERLFQPPDEEVPPPKRLKS